MDQRAVDDRVRRRPRRRPSRRQFLVRRLLVGGGLVVALLLVGLGVRALRSDDAPATLASGADTSATATTGTGTTGEDVSVDDGAAATTEAEEPVGSAVLGGPAITTTTAAATTVPADTTTTTTQPEGPPTAENPAQVLVIGDSNAGSFGPYLKELVDATGVAVTQVDYEVSTGLARPDFFDWPAHIREQLGTVDPDIVVVTFGGNDAQGLADAAGTFAPEYNDPISDAEAWKAEYGRRVGEVMDVLLADGRSVVWVGIPNAQDAEVTARMAVQDAAAKAAAAQRPDVVFVDTWTRFSGRSGNWAEFVVDPRDGVGKDVRADADGFHLNENGAEILALDIANVVRADLIERGAEI